MRSDEDVDPAADFAVEGRDKGAVADQDRLVELGRTGILDSPPEEAFDRLTRLAGLILDVPVSLASFVDADRQFFKSCFGRLADPWHGERQTPLSHSFCQYVVRDRQALVVSDARKHPELKHNLAIPDLGVVAYAGMPLLTPDGFVLGSFCAIDVRPREWTPVELGALRDLTESVNAEIALRLEVADHRRARDELTKRKAQLTSAQELAELGDWEWNVQTDEIEWSSQLYRMHAMPDGSKIEYEAFMALVHPEDRTRVHSAFVESVRGGRGLEVDYRVIRPDGSERHHHSRGHVVTDGDGRALRMHGVVQDVTRRRLVEAELRRAREAAEEATRAKSDFLARMSHEIRTPMNGVIGMTELLMESELTRQQRDHLETVRSSADSLLTLINDVLDFSRLEAKRVDLHLEPFSLRQLLGAVVRPLAHTAGKKGVEVVLRVAPSVPDGLVGDDTRVRQVVVNLVGNAVKFTDEGTVFVEVTAEPLPASDRVSLTVRVADSGIGIPADRLDAVFDSFSQADTSTTREYGGTGLGLAICRSLVEVMGGTIRATSRVGEGSEFTVNLPFSVQEDDARCSASASYPLRGLRVLVIDDNAHALGATAELLTAWGADVVEAPDGREARAAWSGEAFDLLVVDASLPEESGVDLIEALRGGEEYPPAILMTSSAGSLTLVAEAGDRGLNHFLLKPVRAASLQSTLKIALNDRVPGDSRQEQPASPAQQEGPSLRILLAEDNRINRLVIQGILEKRGHELTMVEDGVQALDALEKADYDLVLMDVEMPELDGLEASKRIRERENGARRTPIIAVTAHALAGDRERCLAAGMDDYLTKPVRAQELVEIVATYGAARYGATTSSKG